MSLIKKKFLINTLLVSGSILIVLFVIDVAFHFTGARFAYLSPIEPHGYIKYDPELGFDITPHFATSTHHFYDYSYDVWSNELGCYDYPYDGTSPYIYLTGDSYAWGYTPLEEKWGKIVERTVNVRTLTCGVTGFGTRQEVIKTRRDLSRLPEPPRLILVSYLGVSDPNDDFNFPAAVGYDGNRLMSKAHCAQSVLLHTSPLAPTTTCNVQKPQLSPMRRVAYVLFVNSVIVRMVDTHFSLRVRVEEILKHISPPPAVNENEKSPGFDDDIHSDISWDAHMRAVRAFKELADQYNTQVLFVLIPSREMTRATTTDPAWAHERIKEHLTEYEIPYVDLLPEFRARVGTIRPNPYYWYHDGHWNVAGNRLAGELVSEYVRTHHSQLFQSPTE